MDDADRGTFARLIQDVAEYYDRKLTAAAIEVYWHGLRRYSVDQVRRATSVHVSDPDRGRYMPRVADVVAAIQATQRADGRPGPDEAWSIAVPARDEADTVVWTEEICAAWFAAAVPLMALGDKIAARKAFQDRYATEVAQARQSGRPTKWSVAFGTSHERRRAAILEAEQLGRLSTGIAAKLLPHDPIEPSETMLAIAAQAPDTEMARKAIADLRALFAGVKR